MRGHRCAGVFLSLLAVCACASPKREPAPPAPAPVLAASTAVPAPFDPLPGLTASTSEPETPEFTVARNRWRFSVCYREALAKHPGEAGQIKIRLRIATTGKTEPELVCFNTSSDLASCVLAAFGEMEFAAVHAGKVREVPVILSKDGKKPPACVNGQMGVSATPW